MMGRHQNKYFTGLFLLVLLTFILSKTAPAAQNEAPNKLNKPLVAAAEAAKIKEVKPPESEAVKAKDIKPPESAAGKEVTKDAASPEATAEPAKTDSSTGNTVNYLYDPTNKTDPFKSFLATREEQARTKAKTYLETLELSQLDLIVTVISPKGRWAMVKDSKGMGHVIKEGTPIGTNNGVVYKISQGEVVIREEYKNFRGQMQYRDITKTAQSQ